MSNDYAKLIKIHYNTGLGLLTEKHKCTRWRPRRYRARPRSVGMSTYGSYRAPHMYIRTRNTPYCTYTHYIYYYITISINYFISRQVY